MNQKSALEDKGTVVVPQGVSKDLEDSKWKVWLSPKHLDEPFVIRPAQGKNLRYGNWLNANVLMKKGVYLWLLETGISSQPYRFVHVGISAKGGSTLAERTKVHLRGQMNFTDRIHRLELCSADDPSGTLGNDLRWNEELREEAVKEFLYRLRIVYLLPEDAENETKQITTFEGVISRAAAFILDQKKRKAELDWETTNTLSGTSCWEVDIANANVVTKFLNELIPMFPAEPRFHRV